MNAAKASWIMYTIYGMWIRKAGHSIPDASSFHCSSGVIEQFDEPLSVVIPS